MQWPDGDYESAMADGELGFKETSGTGPLTKNINNPSACDLDRSTMTSGGQGPRVTSSVEASSQVESTTVGEFAFGGD